MSVIKREKTISKLIFDDDEMSHGDKKRKKKGGEISEDAILV